MKKTSADEAAGRVRGLHIVHSGLVAILLALVLSVARQAAAQPGQGISAAALAQIQALVQEKQARTPVQQKLDSQLVYALKVSRKQAIARGVTALRPDVKIDSGGRVLVDIKANVTPGLLQRIKRLGGQVLSSLPRYRAIRARLPLANMEALAGAAEVKFVEPAAEAITNTGSVTSQGDITHSAAAARSTFGVTGSGVKVGVLSDSVDGLANSQASGDLGTVTVLSGQSGVPGTGEGTAMLEIVHDLAPGAQLYFATAFISPASFAQNIRDLRDAGCKVIVDDVTYFNESPFQDAVIAQAVNDVSASGVLYFSSARNSGNKNDATSSTWEGDFKDGGATSIGRGGRLHDFGGGATTNLVAAGGSKRRVDLFWSDPLGASSNDYDLYVLDSSGSSVLRSSTNTQNGNDDPYEAVSTLNVGERIVVVKFSGSSRFLHLDIGRGRLSLSTAGCVRGHNASGAANAFSVAATSVANSCPGGTCGAFVGGSTNPVETFSSDGPRRIFYNPNGTAITPGNVSATGGTVLQKPEITAADAVSTSVAGFGSFSGTSAAAPHAAAIAALIKSFAPSLSPAQVRARLTSGALDIEAAGFDRDSGIGIVMADKALQATSGAITGVKFNDLNGNGIWDSGEPSMSGWTIFLDTNGDGLISRGERSTTTGLFGLYSFPNLRPGTYRVREVVQQGWVNATPNPVLVAVSSGQRKTGVNFGNFKTISISGRKFHDANGNKVQDRDEEGLPNWTIFIDTDHDGLLDRGELFAITDKLGNYTITGVGPGTHRVREVHQPGSVQTTPNPADIVASSGTNVTGINFGNIVHGRLVFHSTTFSVDEGGGTGVATVDRVGGSDGTVSVAYAISNGTALTPGDYTSGSGFLTFVPGETSKTFNVPIVDDALDENNETVALALSSPGGGAALGTPSTAALIIVDNDPLPTLSIDDVTVTEGNSGTVDAKFTITLNPASGRNVTVTYATANDTATAPDDYVAVPNTALTFLPGETSKTVAVQVNGDVYDEADETFKVVLQGAPEANIVDDTGVGTILDDDPLPKLVIRDAVLAEGDSGATNMLFAVVLNGATKRTVTVKYATANGSAAVGSDYTAATGTLTFSPGLLSQFVAVFPAHWDPKLRIPRGQVVAAASIVSPKY